MITEDVKLDPDSTSSFISGCEFDYSANTYRLQVTTSSGSVTIGENFVIVKVDGATGMPKVLSVRWNIKDFGFFPWANTESLVSLSVSNWTRMIH